jgi:hypothetical protein
MNPSAWQRPDNGNCNLQEYPTVDTVENIEQRPRCLTAHVPLLGMKMHRARAAHFWCKARSVLALKSLRSQQGKDQVTQQTGSDEGGKRIIESHFRSPQRRSQVCA